MYIALNYFSVDLSSVTHTTIRMGNFLIIQRKNIQERYNNCFKTLVKTTEQSSFQLTVE